MHPDIKTEGNIYHLDSTDIAAIISAWNPHTHNYIPTLLDPADSFGTCMRVAVQLGSRYLGIIESTATRRWMQAKWISLLAQNTTVTPDQVCAYYSGVIHAHVLMLS